MFHTCSLSIPKQEQSLDIAVSIGEHCKHIYICDFANFSERKAKHKTFEESEFRVLVELGLIVKADQYMQGVPFVMWKAVVLVFLWLQNRNHVVPRPY